MGPNPILSRKTSALRFALWPNLNSFFHFCIMRMLLALMFGRHAVFGNCYRPVRYGHIRKSCMKGAVSCKLAQTSAPLERFKSDVRLLPSHLFQQPRRIGNYTTLWDTIAGIAPERAIVFEVAGSQISCHPLLQIDFRRVKLRNIATWTCENGSRRC